MNSTSKYCCCFWMS